MWGFGRRWRIEPLAILEVGTSKVTALVAEMREDGHITITGAGRHDSSGVRKGEVVDFENARICVGGALADAEEQSDVEVHHARRTGSNHKLEYNGATQRMPNYEYDQLPGFQKAREICP